MKARRSDLAVVLAMVVLAVIICIANRMHPITYEMYTSEGITYEKGTVRRYWKKIWKESRAQNGIGGNRC